MRLNPHPDGKGFARAGTSDLMAIQANTNLNIRRSKGFTLVELVIVVAIVGILAAVAVPNFQSFMLKTRRGEAYTQLSDIYRKQMVFYVENKRYGNDFTEIRFQVGGGTVIDANTIQGEFYTYTLETFDVGGVVSADYQAVATADLNPNDALLDVVMIDGGLINP
jgi:prepilin-type N-terminal cleavage/methylation domain-containing protein